MVFLSNLNWYEPGSLFIDDKILMEKLNFELKSVYIYNVNTNDLNVI